MSKLTDSIANLPPEKRILLELRLKKRFGDEKRSEKIFPRASRDAAPLSFAQERLWFMHQLLPDNPMYNIAVTVHISSGLNIATLEQAIGEIIRRHETLRTRFPLVGRGPVQWVAPFHPLLIPVTDLGRLTDHEQQCESQRSADIHATRLSDISKVAPFSYRLLRPDRKGVRLLLNIHHIACDGWSQSVFIRELIAIYEAFAEGSPSPLAELKIQYADYACWQRERKERNIYQAQLDYWRVQLLGAKVLDWPFKTNQSRQEIPRGTSKEIRIPEDLSLGLRTVARQAKCTLFEVLLAAFKTLLHRYTGEDDIVIGTPTANRRPVETECLIGCFINLLTLRTDLSGNPSFQELLRRISGVTLDAYTHQEIPFHLLVQELNLSRRTDDMPLFRNLFVFHNTPRPGSSRSRLRCHVIENKEKALPFDLILSLIESGPNITGTLRYNIDLIDEDLAVRFIEQFKGILDEISICPDLRILDIPMDMAGEGKYIDQISNFSWETQTDEQFVFD